MTTTDADQIRREIEGTQRELSADVNALTDKVNPKQIVHRRVGRIRHSLSSAKDRIMGTTDAGTSAAGDRISSAANSAAETASSVASSVKESAQDMPEAIRRSTEGNPLAAGLIVFGISWLGSSLLPPTRQEKRLAAQAKDFVQDHAQPVAEQLSQAASEVKEHVRESAQQAAESVKSAATEAASAVGDEARSATEDVAGRAGEAKEHIRPARPSNSPPQ